MKKLIIIFLLIASTAWGFEIKRAGNYLNGNTSQTGTLGTTSILNGTFDTDASWSKGTGWAIDTGDSNNAIATATTDNLNETSSTVVAGKYYVLGFDAVVTSGTFQITAGGWTSDLISVSVTSGCRYFYATTAGAVTFDGVTSFTGTIDNVTLKEVSATSMFDNIAFGTTEIRQPLVFKRTLNRATGNQVAYHFTYETNKATSGNDTGLLIDMLDTASPGTSYLIDAQTGGASKFRVDNAGVIYSASTILTPQISHISGGGNQFQIATSNQSASFNGVVAICPSTFSGAGVTTVAVKIPPTYNQTTTSSATDLQINRTETAVGTGAQKLISLGKGGASYVEYFGVDNIGIRTFFVGANVASGDSITPTGPIFHVTGVTTINTIVVPTACTAGCRVMIIPDGIFVTGVTGNIALASTSVVSKVLTMVYDAGTSKWYPSY